LPSPSPTTPPLSGGFDPNAVLARALERGQAGSRNDAAVWLSCQLRDNGTPLAEAEGLLRAFAADVGTPEGKGRYTKADALATVRSVYRRPAREPWAGSQTGGAKPAKRPRKRYDPTKVPKVNGELGDADAATREAVRLLQMDPEEAAAHSAFIRREEERIEREAASLNLDIEDAPLFPRAVYDLLPPSIVNAAAHYTEPHQPDVFTAGLLPVLGAMLPNVWTRHQRRYISPNTYVVVTAETGSGKNVLEDVRAVARPLSDALALRRAEELARWKDEKEAAEAAAMAVPTEPPHYRLFVPANASATPFLRALQKNEGRGLVFETEIYPLTQARGNEWGDYTATLLQAYGHETVSLLRSQEEFYIPNPCVSVTLSGTPDQVLRLIPSVEDGLFSRFGFFYFVGTDEWIDHGPAAGFDDFNATLSIFGEMMARAYHTLHGRPERLFVDISPDGWATLQEPFRQMKARAIANGQRPLISAVHRGPIMAARFAMCLTLLSHIEEGRDLTPTVRSVEVREKAVWAGSMIAATLVDHAFRLAQHLPKAQALKTAYSRDVLTRFALALPDRFDHQALLSTATALELKQSAAYKYRAKLLQLGWAEPDGYGWCKKSPRCPSPSSIGTHGIEHDD